MSRFNLLDEPWIVVMEAETGTPRQVSLSEIFHNTHHYQGLAGDSVTQDFAVFRCLLSVLHTVFSRFDFQGEAYGYVGLTDRWQPTEQIQDEDDRHDYEEALLETWQAVWERGEFPSIITSYLEKWRDRFYLYDEAFPFFQVTADDISADKISKSKASEISGKNVNRLISESGNKTALFAPKSEQYKEQLSSDEIARWLLVYQGYTGLSDKVIFGREKYKASKGWLFDIGAVMLEGSNLFETLWLNCALVHPEESSNFTTTQTPCWEYSGAENIRRRLNGQSVSNLAELYTIWSRAVYIDPDHDDKAPFSFEVVKLPEIEHVNQFLELMSLWRYNDSGDNKGKFTPRKHRLNQAVWRSFGLITLSYEVMDKSDKSLPQRKPGIIDWLSLISSNLGDFSMTLKAISMQDDGNATSWVPTDEIYDRLNIMESVLTDIDSDGWIPRINEVVSETKRVVGFIYQAFLTDLKEIRNISSSAYVSQQVEDLYFLIDQPFRAWIESIRPRDSKDEKVIEWRQTLRRLVLEQADRVMSQAGPRDYRGIVKDERMKNIATVYNFFISRLRKQLPDKEA